MPYLHAHGYVHTHIHTHAGARIVLNQANDLLFPGTLVSAATDHLALTVAVPLPQPVFLSQGCQCAVPEGKEARGCCFLVFKVICALGSRA